MNELFGKQALRRQVNVLLLSLCVLVMAAGIADATHSPGQGPPKDLVSGTAEANLGGPSLIHLNATSGPAGEDPSGHSSLDDVIFGNQNVRGPITCLAVSGDSALVVGVVEKSQHSLFPEGFLVVIEITDMEEPSPDRLHFIRH
jgi:hypothetical protein